MTVAASVVRALTDHAAEYDLEMVLDESLTHPTCIDIESGDHGHLIRSDSDHFSTPMRGVRRGHISTII